MERAGAEQKSLDAGCVVMDAINALRVCTVAMTDANQSFPYGHGLKCSNGADASEVYFGVCTTLETVADAPRARRSPAAPPASRAKGGDA